MFYNLSNALRLFTFQGPVRGSFSKTPLAALFAVLLLIAIRVLAQAINVWPIGTFSFWSIPHFATTFLIEMGLLLAVVACFARRLNGLQIIVAYAICHCVYALAVPLAYKSGLLEGWEYHHYILLYAAFLLFLVIRLPRFVEQMSWGFPVSLGAALTLGFALQLPFMDYSNLFYPEMDQTDAANNENNPPSVDAETVYYAQSHLMAKQLAKLEMASPDRPNLFAILGAGTANQRVFIREITSVGDILTDKFGPQTPVIQLANSNWDTQTYPLANKTNIETALTETAQKMDPAKDVAMLFLTSHGSDDNFSLSFYDLSMRSMSAKALSAILERSKIKNLVIVLSACYSGSFIDDLEAPDRAIFTATDSENTSFGCSDENEWTWFGDAFFNQALRNTHSFKDAFTKARSLVTKWESETGYTTSNPQMRIGPEIEPRLKALTQSRSDQQAAL